MGFSNSFLWKYDTSTKQRKQWNLLGNVSCTNIQPQMVPPPTGPLSPYNITSLACHDLANIFQQCHLISNFPKNAALLSSGQSVWGGEPTPAHSLLWLSKTPCQDTAAGRKPQSMTSAMHFEVDKICTHGHLSVISCTHSFVLLYCQRTPWMMSLFSEENRPSELFTDIINYL